ncbi:MAG: DUF1616 domain-containing protein [Desulfurococcaceae archaeon]
MILDDEVFAVILAVTIVSSVVGIAMVLRQEAEQWTALGLLGECKIGKYPKTAVNGSLQDLCIYVANYMGKPVYYKVIYRVGDQEALPTNTTPSPSEPLAFWIGVLGNKDNATVPVKVPITVRGPLPRKVALIFELWLYDTGTHEWIYSGRWVHVYVNVTLIPMEGTTQ